MLRIPQVLVISADEGQDETWVPNSYEKEFGGETRPLRVREESKPSNGEAYSAGNQGTTLFCLSGIASTEGNSKS